MTTLTIEIPDNVTEDVLKYLKGKDVVIKQIPLKNIDDLTIDDYRIDTYNRAKKTRDLAAKYL